MLAALPNILYLLKQLAANRYSENYLEILTTIKALAEFSSDEEEKLHLSTRQSSDVGEE